VAKIFNGNGSYKEEAGTVDILTAVEPADSSSVQRSTLKKRSWL